MKPETPFSGLETVLSLLRRIPFPVAFQKLFINPAWSSSSPHLQAPQAVCLGGGVEDGEKILRWPRIVRHGPKAQCAWFLSLAPSLNLLFISEDFSCGLFLLPKVLQTCTTVWDPVATFGKQGFEWPLFWSPRSLAGFLPPYITGSSCIGSGSWPGHYISTGLKTYRPWWAVLCERGKNSDTGKAETDHWGPRSRHSSRGNLGSLGGALSVIVPKETAAELLLVAQSKASSKESLD